MALTICGIHHTHAEMRRALAWLENRFPFLRGPAVVDGDEDGAGDALVDTEVKGYLDKAVIRDGRGKKKVVPELFVWVKSAVELLGAWSTVLMDVQEGLLIAMRQRELRRQAREWEGGEEEKKARMPPLEAGGGAGLDLGMMGAGAGMGGGALALNWAKICASRRTLRVSVNSSLGPSILC